MEGGAEEGIKQCRWTGTEGPKKMDGELRLAPSTCRMCDAFSIVYTCLFSACHAYICGKECLFRRTSRVSDFSKSDFSKSRVREKLWIPFVIRFGHYSLAESGLEGCTELSREYEYLSGKKIEQYLCRHSLGEACLQLQPCDLSRLPPLSTEHNETSRGSRLGQARRVPPDPRWHDRDSARGAAPPVAPRRRGLAPPPRAAGRPHPRTHGALPRPCGARVTARGGLVPRPATGRRPLPCGGPPRVAAGDEICGWCRRPPTALPRVAPPDRSGESPAPSIRCH